MIHLRAFALLACSLVTLNLNAQISNIDDLIPLDGVVVYINKSSKNIEFSSSSATYLNNPAPEYPERSKILGEQGRVIIKVLTDKEGLAQKFEIFSSSGFARLDQSALSAIKKWKFISGRLNGFEEDIWYEVPINFVLVSEEDRLVKP
jgi:TonB family protein